MNLTRLTLINFRNVEYAEIDLDGSTLLLGNEGEGKSTILNALQMCLFGWCEHTDKRGAGYATLIRRGAKEAGLRLDFDDRRIILDLAPKSRSWSLIDPETGEIDTDIASPAALWESLGINMTHAMVCAFPTQIVGGSEFSSILSDYLRDNLTRDALMARVPAEHMAPLANLASGHHMNLDSVTDFEAAGALAYAKRTDVNRDLKMAEGAIKETGFIKPAVLPDGTVLTVADMAALEAKRAAHVAELNTLRVELGRAQQAATATVLDVEATEVELNSHRAVLTVAESALAAIQLDVQAQWDLNEAKTAQTAAQRSKDKAEATRDAVSTDCPTCKRKLTPAMRKDLIADAQLAVDAAVQVLTLATETAEAKLNAWRAAEYVGDNADVVGKRRSWATQEIHRLERALADQVPAYDGPSVAEVEAAINAKQVETQFVETQLRVVTRQHELAECVRHAEALRRDYEHLDWIVKEFHDGRAYRALLVEAAAPIVAEVNAWIAGSLEIVAEGKAFGLVFNGSPLAVASRGQQTLVAYAFARAFAHCGAPILLDDTNNVCGKTCGTLAARLQAAASGTVILAGISKDTSPEYFTAAAAALAPMRVVSVSDGTYRVVPVVAQVAA